MADVRQPKVILFDIGGVCIKSPFQAILDYELSLGIPPGWVNYSISKTAPNGYWQKLERGDIPMDDDYFRGFSQDLHNAERWEAFYKREQAKHPQLPSKVPPVPKVDARWLFDEMMASANHPDPWMYPALKNLKASGKYILAALSNTAIFSPDHPMYNPDYLDDPVRSLFDIFMSSAHIGIRKPDPAMYWYARHRVNEYAKLNAATPRGKALGWAAGVQPEDILFLDDIGENLKEARRQGFRTIKAPLGRAYEAVDELEKATGLKLAGTHPRVPATRSPKSKI
ncbi:hypothetical protein NLU13_3274 [Sarocladium strictum]|uniref:Epoxide hydrolase n=1 Tax=Sarocladium strictum TaxID=5046 RepID=A0AA39L9K7_SARSR|nr:hypothetical protein NLU13_3274 [Sarocladium strictum]